MVVHQDVSVQLAACGVQGLMHQVQIAQSIAIIQKAGQRLFPRCTMCGGMPGRSMHGSLTMAQDSQPGVGADSEETLPKAEAVA
ncbi:hypothetical protein [Xanthomonas arboricola]|uniref:hypothetical protein n=1 Tax=Xanthomonas arboricola TaxID=56448 RepID=UPI001FD80A5C|nr:hypothetical protein [Xanthomonas arboricola]